MKTPSTTRKPVLLALAQVEYYENLATVSIRRLWSLRLKDSEAIAAIRGWVGLLRDAKRVRLYRNWVA